jgi:hypothetical protein
VIQLKRNGAKIIDPTPTDKNKTGFCLSRWTLHANKWRPNAAFDIQLTRVPNQPTYCNIGGSIQQRKHVRSGFNNIEYPRVQTFASSEHAHGYEDELGTHLTRL